MGQFRRTFGVTRSEGKFPSADAPDRSSTRSHYLSGGKDVWDHQMRWPQAIPMAIGVIESAFPVSRSGTSRGRMLAGSFG